MKFFAKIKQGFREIRQLPKGERWSYFWDYYKWYIIVTALVIALLVQGIVGMVNQKETVFSGFVLNARIGVEDETFLEGFYSLTGIDSKTQQAAFYTDLILTGESKKTDITTIQRILASVSMQDGDLVISTGEGFHTCAYNTSRIFYDLRDFLDAETLEKLSDRLYYIDGAVQDELDKPVGEFVDPYAIQYPDPRKPETMKNPIPVGIDVSDRKDLMDAYYLKDTTAYLGIIINTPRQALCQQFIDYLFP